MFETMPLRPLKGHCVVDTRMLDEARDVIGRIFCPHFLTLRSRDHAGFHAVHNAVQGPDYSVNFVAYGAEVEIDPGELSEFFLLQIPLRGEAEVRCGTRLAYASASSRATLLSPTLPTRMIWKAGCEKVIILLRRKMVETFYEATTHRPRQAIEFEPSIDMRSAVGQGIVGHARMMLFAAQQGAGLPDAYRVLLRDGLASLMLSGIANNLSNMLVNGCEEQGPLPVRRAREFIYAHAAGIISMGDIAAAAGIPLRTLQDAYRKTTGLTLTAAVQAVRLERLREALTVPAPALTVADAVLASGFGHLGRAAAAYRVHYGESPSDTLRRTLSR